MTKNEFIALARSGRIFSPLPSPLFPAILVRWKMHHDHEEYFENRHFYNPDATSAHFQHAFAAVGAETSRVLGLLNIDTGEFTECKHEKVRIIGSEENYRGAACETCGHMMDRHPVGDQYEFRPAPLPN